MLHRMEVEVNGTRLWFDVDGPALVPDGPSMRERPTVVVVHGGPASYDHSYFKPHFSRLTDVAQVVYVDLRDHGRSARHDPSLWSLEVCADDLCAFCDSLGIVGPVVFGHSMGGLVALLFGVRYPDRPRALILGSTMARFDLRRMVEGFRSVAGDEVAELARRDYGGDPVSDAEWAAVFAAFGPHVLSVDELARPVQHRQLAPHGMDRLRKVDVVDQLTRVACPTLVCVGELDPLTPVAASVEIFEALPPALGRLEVIEGAGHFPWLDAPERYWSIINSFVTAHRHPLTP
jgi:pimeloyl-ACP methyl ester carboxylesterase